MDDGNFAQLLEAAMGDLNLPAEARERVRTMPKEQQVKERIFDSLLFFFTLKQLVLTCHQMIHFDALLDGHGPQAPRLVAIYRSKSQHPFLF